MVDENEEPMLDVAGQNPLDNILLQLVEENEEPMVDVAGQNPHDNILLQLVSTMETAKAQLASISEKSIAGME